MDFGCPENRWAYHSINDDIEHVVWAGSLQHRGENTLAVVKGIAAEDEESFPRRMEQDDDSSTSVSSSGLTYFTLMGGTVISVSAKTATIGFTALATVMALTMPLIVHYTKPKAENRQEQMARRSTRWKQFLLAFLNFILGFGVCIAAYASFCLWKQPTDLQLTSKDGADYVANLAWGGIGYLRSILSCFALMCTTLLVYWRSRKLKEDSLDSDVNSSGYETLLFQFGKDIYVGVFYFYTSLLFLMGFIMRDCAVFVLWQSIWMWLGAEAEMILSWYVTQEQWKRYTVSQRAPRSLDRDIFVVRFVTRPQVSHFRHIFEISNLRLPSGDSLRLIRMNNDVLVPINIR